MRIHLSYKVGVPFETCAERFTGSDSSGSCVFIHDNVGLSTLYQSQISSFDKQARNAELFPFCAAVHPAALPYYLAMIFSCFYEPFGTDGSSQTISSKKKQPSHHLLHLPRMQLFYDLLSFLSVFRKSPCPNSSVNAAQSRSVHGLQAVPYPHRSAALNHPTVPVRHLCSCRSLYLLCNLIADKTSSPVFKYNFIPAIIGLTDQTIGFTRRRCSNP